MRYPIISWETGNKYVLSRRANLHSSPALPLEHVGDLEAKDLYTAIEAQIGGLVTAAAERGLANPKIDKDQIEGELALALYKHLDALPTKMLSNLDFWRFLACGPFYDFIHWRDGENCKLQSFGVSAPGLTADCVPYRMYLRVSVATSDLSDFDPEDKTSPLYGQVAKGRRTDVWRSHILRVRTAYSPILVRALLDEHSQRKLSTNVIREAAKVIKRKRANIIFEMLESDEAADALTSAITMGEQLAGKSSTKV